MVKRYQVLSSIVPRAILHATTGIVFDRGLDTRQGCLLALTTYHTSRILIHIPCTAHLIVDASPLSAGFRSMAEDFQCTETF